MSKKIVLASNNHNKIKEFQEILNSKDIELISQSTLNIPEAEETGLTFVENALIKARNASYLSKLPAIADDSGIEVDALLGGQVFIQPDMLGLIVMIKKIINYCLTS